MHEFTPIFLWHYSCSFVNSWQRKIQGSKMEFRHPAVLRVAHHRGTYSTGSHV
jgi:hypothetical protein